MTLFIYIMSSDAGKSKKITILNQSGWQKQNINKYNNW